VPGIDDDAVTRGHLELQEQSGDEFRMGELLAQVPVGRAGLVQDRGAAAAGVAIADTVRLLSIAARRPRPTASVIDTDSRCALTA
jgi:hypothetical protein